MPIVHIVECGSAGRLLQTRPACVSSVYPSRSSDSRKKERACPPMGHPLSRGDGGPGLGLREDTSNRFYANLLNTFASLS